MTVLSPFILWFLTAISIPVIIHFLSRLRIKKVDFSTVRFIKTLERSTMRKTKIRQLILMLLRIGVIAAFVFMMARPVTEGFIPGWIAAELDSRLVLVIDNSASMNVKTDTGTFLERSISGASSIIGYFGEQTTVDIVQTCPPEILYTGKINDPIIPAVLESIPPSVNNDNIWSIVDSVVTRDRIYEPIRECIIFSDFQHRPDTSFNKNNNTRSKWHYYFINPGKVQDNLSIDNVEIINRIKIPNQLLKLRSRVKNSGRIHSPNTPLELFFNDHRVGQVISEFEPGSKREFIFQAYPGIQGILKGKVQLPNDDYEQDNIWYISLPILESIHCLLLGSSQEDITMLKMVFSAIDPDGEFLKIEAQVQPSLNRLFIDDQDVVVIHNPIEVTESGVEAINNYLRNGGGIIWFSGEMDMERVHPDLFDRIGFPKPEEVVRAGDGFFNVSLPDVIPEILSDLNIRSIDKEIPECFQYVRHTPSSKHNVHLRLNNGDPYLMEFTKGSGYVFYLTSLLDLNWSDLPVRGILVPLMYKLLILAGTDEVNTSPVIVGTPKWISLDQDILRNQWEVETPSGKKELIVPDFNREGIMFYRTTELGTYNVFQDGELYTSFSTQLHPDEALYNKITKDDLNKNFTDEDHKWLNLDSDFKKDFMELRQGKSLWRTFLILACIFLLTETLLGRPIPQQLKKEDTIE